MPNALKKLMRYALVQTVDKVIFKIDKNKGKTKFSLLLN